MRVMETQVNEAINPVSKSGCQGVSVGELGPEHGLWQQQSLSAGESGGQGRNPNKRTLTCKGTDGQEAVKPVLV